MRAFTDKAGAGIDTSQFELIFPIDKVESKVWSSDARSKPARDSSSSARAPTPPGEDVTVNTGRASGVRELGLASRATGWGPHSGASSGSVSNTRAGAAMRAPVVAFEGPATESGWPSALGIGLLALIFGGGCMSISIGVGAESPECGSALSMRTSANSVWEAAATETPAIS